MKFVVIPAHLQSELRTWSRASTEREACGALIGSRAADLITITHVERLRNVSPRPDSFECDSATIVALDRHLAGKPCEIVGFWHSHASGESTPSTHDAWGAWPGSLTAIVCPTHTPPLRFWRFEGTTSIEVRAITPIAGHPLSARTPCS
ncbi:MAG: Mov34/MPN/PAD-1 family protein [Planctomycetota bacterium]|nr:Mov34/MPN/PAD-1 family protein [Planctomycetota bacterium]